MHQMSVRRCRRCGATIELMRGLWWAKGTAEFQCPDGEESHTAGPDDVAEERAQEIVSPEFVAQANKFMDERQPVMAYDSLGMYCAAGRTVLAVTTPNDLNWTEPCPELPTGRHVIDFRGAGRETFVGKMSFCRTHGEVIVGDIRRWLAIWGDDAAGSGPT